MCVKDPTEKNLDCTGKKQAQAGKSQMRESAANQEQHFGNPEIKERPLSGWDASTACSCLDERGELRMDGEWSKIPMALVERSGSRWLW